MSNGTSAAKTTGQSTDAPKANPVHDAITSALSAGDNRRALALIVAGMSPEDVIRTLYTRKFLQDGTGMDGTLLGVPYRIRKNPDGTFTGEIAKLNRTYADGTIAPTGVRATAGTGYAKMTGTSSDSAFWQTCFVRFGRQIAQIVESAEVPGAKTGQNAELQSALRTQDAMRAAFRTLGKTDAEIDAMIASALSGK